MRFFPSKKAIFIALFALPIFTFSALALSPLPPFEDASGFADWFKEDVNIMKNYSVLEGYPDGEFKPERNVNRAELAVILNRYTKFVHQMDLSEIEQHPVCTLEFRSGLILHLQDSNGEPITDAEIATDEGVSDFNHDENNPGTYSGLGEQEGYFTLSIKAPDVNRHRETIKLEQDACHVITQERTITLF